MPSSVKTVPVQRLGEPSFPSPLQRTSAGAQRFPRSVPEDRYVRSCVEVGADGTAEEELLFEKAGPRERLYFDPPNTRAAVVTCGGLCPGLNDVIRSLYLELAINYGVKEVWGIRYGYQGLNPAAGEPPVRLTLEMVEDIHREGGTILGSSRGPQDARIMTDFLVQRGIDVLFCVGGDGTQRGAHALYEEIGRRGAKIAIVGIPKTIDNDIPYCDQSFGLLTAVEQAQRVLDCAHVESKGVMNGIGLVKVMGREAGFIAAAATLASQDVNFTLVPEVPFALHGERGFLSVLRKRMLERRHAVIVVAEGAGQELFRGGQLGRDASGNVKLEDIGPLLKREILAYFAEHGPSVDVKYIDPSYIIRSVPANCEDSALCDQFARRAVHAAMAGKTDVLVGRFNARFVHVPIPMVVAQKRRMPADGELWASVLAATGQPARFEGE